MTNVRQHNALLPQQFINITVTFYSEDSRV